MAFALMLGGVEILPHAGTPEPGNDELGGSTVLRLSDGTGVKMTRWEKLIFTIGASGFAPPGLDGLDYGSPMEFRSNHPETMQSTERVFSLISPARPDHAPWGFALVDERLQRAPVSIEGSIVTVADVPGARLYQVWWFPVYSVFAKRPTKTQSPSSGRWTWSMTLEEA